VPTVPANNVDKTSSSLHCAVGLRRQEVLTQ